MTKGGPAAIQAKLKEGLELHQKGEFTQAQALYEEILKLQPEHADALHLLGVIAYQARNAGRAVELIGKAIELNPDNAAAYSNRGLALQQLARPQAALESYDCAIALKADYAEAHNNRGNVLRDLKRPQAALQSYDRAIALKPDFAEACNNRGVALQDLKQHQAGLESYDRAIALKADYAEAYGNRGNALRDLGLPEAALESYDRAIALKADYAEAHNNRGNVLRDLKQPQAALDSYGRAIALDPEDAEAYNNRGNALRDLKQPQAALESYDRAIALKTDFAEAYNSRGIALQDLRQHDAALESYDRAIASRPDYAEAHWNQGLCHLQMGNYAAGWEKYEWRWKNESFTSPKRNFARPLWSGTEALQGKTILLHGEQGLGDTIQFCRYAKLVAGLGARVVLEVPSPLSGLLAGLDGVAELAAQGGELPEFDCHCPLLSLPLAFKTGIDDIPASRRYISADVRKVAEWRAKLGDAAAPRVGLAWSGRTGFRSDHNRSIPLGELASRLPRGVQYLSLQKDLRDADREILKSRADILHFGEDLKDFADTAALCELADVIISVDTSVAHLAAAMGKPVWILLLFNPDWRWLLDRTDSPWYPSATLFRQDENGGWDSVLERVRAELTAWLAPRGQSA